MKPKKQSAQSKANQAFLAKIATINIGGSKHGPNCPDCGKPMEAGHLKLIGVGIGLRRKPQPPKSNDEQSFAC